MEKGPPLQSGFFRAIIRRMIALSAKMVRDPVCSEPVSVQFPTKTGIFREI